MDDLILRIEKKKVEKRWNMGLTYLMLGISVGANAFAGYQTEGTPIPWAAAVAFALFPILLMVGEFFLTKVSVDPHRWLDNIRLLVSGVVSFGLLFGSVLHLQEFLVWLGVSPALAWGLALAIEAFLSLGLLTSVFNSRTYKSMERELAAFKAAQHQQKLDELQENRKQKEQERLDFEAAGLAKLPTQEDLPSMEGSEYPELAQSFTEASGPSGEGVVVERRVGDGQGLAPLVDLELEAKPPELMLHGDSLDQPEGVVSPVSVDILESVAAEHPAETLDDVSAVERTTSEQIAVLAVSAKRLDERSDQTKQIILNLASSSPRPTNREIANEAGKSDSTVRKVLLAEAKRVASLNPGMSVDELVAATGATTRQATTALKAANPVVVG